MTASASLSPASLLGVLGVGLVWHRRARTSATVTRCARQPGGRLDPTLTLALDEAALISPVPLHLWTADMGGRGVTIICAFQSRAQMLARYGEHNAATILNNTGSVMVFGGTRDRDDLSYWSVLGGERDEPITTTDLNGRVASRTLRKVPVLAPAQLANLPAGRVVAFRRGMAPVIGRAEMAWRRRDVRALHNPDGRWELLRGAVGRIRAGRPWREEIATLFGRAPAQPAHEAPVEPADGPVPEWLWARPGADEWPADPNETGTGNGSGAPTGRWN